MQLTKNECSGILLNEEYRGINNLIINLFACALLFITGWQCQIADTCTCTLFCFLESGLKSREATPKEKKIMLGKVKKPYSLFVVACFSDRFLY